MDIEIEMVYDKHCSSLDSEILSYWKKNDIGVPRKDIKTRLKQVSTIARRDSEIIGLVTLKKAFIKSLGQFFYIYASSTAKSARAGKSRLAYSERVDAQLFFPTFDHFNQLYSPLNCQASIGFLVVVETSKRTQILSKAVEPYSNLIFMGFNQRGQQTHVKYFDDAVIRRQLAHL